MASELSRQQVPSPHIVATSLQQFVYQDTTSPSQSATRAVSSTAKLTPPPPSRTFRNLSRTSTAPITTASSSSSSSKKRKRSTGGYAPPSRYSHITNHLTDTLAPDLICIFIGVNPGIRTATSGHAYAHPSNLFWKLAHKSGCTPRLCKPEEDVDLPHLYALGHTNIVTRPTRDASELSNEEMGGGVAVLEEKVRRLRPECVCLVGKSIWETVWRVRHGRKIRKEEFSYGWQDEGENMGVVGGSGEDYGGVRWPGARVFVATTTSGLAAGMRPHEKEEIWRGLGEFVERRRREKGIPDGGRARVH